MARLQHPPTAVRTIDPAQSLLSGRSGIANIGGRLRGGHTQAVAVIVDQRPQVRPHLVYAIESRDPGSLILLRGGVSGTNRRER